jgi:D-lyxose ketol-isomerase
MSIVKIQPIQEGQNEGTLTSDLTPLEKEFFQGTVFETKPLRFSDDVPLKMLLFKIKVKKMPKEILSSISSKSLKRSEINRILADAVSIFGGYQFHLPPWAFWNMEEWQSKGSEYDEIRTKRLGWDITDFGLGDFRKYGLVLFTLRNGAPDPAASKNYCEKIMIARHEQYTPEHYHVRKTEDIINRGGAELVMYLRPAEPQSGLPLNNVIRLQCDGVTRTAEPHKPLRLKPGESITLEPYVYHTFCADGGTALLGEVSRSNDDCMDNFSAFH